MTMCIDIVPTHIHLPSDPFWLRNPTHVDLRNGEDRSSP
jgi:hypothetical protein